MEQSEQSEQSVTRQPATSHVPMASTTPPPIMSPKDLTSKRYTEKSRTQHEKPALNREVPSPRHSSPRNHRSTSSTGAPELDSDAFEQHHSQSLRKTAPKPSQVDKHLRSDQTQRKTTSPKTNPEQVHAILARLGNETRQSSNHAPTTATSATNRSDSRAVEASSLKSFENGGSDASSKMTTNDSRPLPSPKYVPSTRTSNHKQDNKQIHVSRPAEKVHNTEPTRGQQTLTDARNALSSTFGVSNTGQERSSKHVEETSQVLSGQSNKRQHLLRTNEHEDTSEGQEDLFSLLKVDLSNTHNIQEIVWHEEAAIKIWTDLLHQMGAADVYLSEGTVFLIANARVLRTLNEEAFQIVWRVWWQSRPEKTEDEWAHHFNHFCVPFYAAHVAVFSMLYRQHLDNMPNGNRESTAARVYGDVARTIPMGSAEPKSAGFQPKEDLKNGQTTSAVRLFQAEPSPELGSKTYSKLNTRNSPEPKSSETQQHATEISMASAPLLKRARSSSEVPESPRTPLDTNTLISKRYRVGKHDERVANNHKTSISKPNGHSRSSWTLRSTVEESPDPDASQPGSPGDPKMQANIDRQLWLEEEDAEQAGNSFMEREQISTDDSPFTNGIHDHMTEDGTDTLKAKRYWNYETAEDQLLAASDDSEPHPATPEPPSMSELSAQQGSVLHNSGPFYEASEAAIQGDYEDLMSQRTGLLEAPFAPQSDILPSIEEKGTETIGSNKQTNDAENESESEEKQESISDWIKRQLKRGHSEEILTLVLNASMMNANLARKALSYHKKFKRLPNTKPGIWTEEDDNMLLMHSRKGKRTLIEKHGREALDQRREYLETIKLA